MIIALLYKVIFHRYLGPDIKFGKKRVVEVEWKDAMLDPSRGMCGVDHVMLNVIR